MAEPIFAPPEPPVLPDAWERRAPILLSGVLERQKYPPILTACFALILALVLFQGISTVATLGLLLLRGITVQQLMADLPGLLESQASQFLLANTIGQVLGLAAFSWWLARRHTGRPAAFLRLRTPDGAMTGLAVLGLLALLPVVQWMGALNEALPLPDVIRQLDESQMELIEKVLSGDLGLLFSLAMLAVTPALCEELLFRGYVQRQAERGLGAAAGIIASGVVFGVYHLRLTQVLPLSLLGIYLAFLAWRTGSLWIPILAHFLNNALAVVVAAYLQTRPDLDLEAVEAWAVPWYLVAAGLLVFGLVLYGFRQRAAYLLAQQHPSHVFVPTHE